MMRGDGCSLSKLSWWCRYGELCTDDACTEDAASLLPLDLDLCWPNPPAICPHSVI